MEDSEADNEGSEHDSDGNDGFEVVGKSKEAKKPVQKV
jgi:hypothetical protein